MRVYEGAPGTSDSPLADVTLKCSGFTVTLVNTTGSPATVTLNLYPPGGSAATDNQIVPAASCAAHSVATVHFPLGLNIGDVISGKQGTASACNVFIDVVPSE